MINNFLTALSRADVDAPFCDGRLASLSHLLFVYGICIILEDKDSHRKLSDACRTFHLAYCKNTWKLPFVAAEILSRFVASLVKRVLFPTSQFTLLNFQATDWDAKEENLYMIHMLQLYKM